METIIKTGEMYKTIFGLTFVREISFLSTVVDGVVVFEASILCSQANPRDGGGYTISEKVHRITPDYFINQMMVK